MAKLVCDKCLSLEVNCCVLWFLTMKRSVNCCKRDCLRGHFESDKLLASYLLGMAKRIAKITTNPHSLAIDIGIPVWFV